MPIDAESSPDATPAGASPLVRSQVETDERHPVRHSGLDPESSGFTVDSGVRRSDGGIDRNQRDDLLARLRAFGLPGHFFDAAGALARLTGEGGPGAVGSTFDAAVDSPRDWAGEAGRHLAVAEGWPGRGRRPPPLARAALLEASVAAAINALSGADADGHQRRPTTDGETPRPGPAPQAIGGRRNDGVEPLAQGEAENPAEVAFALAARALERSGYPAIAGAVADERERRRPGGGGAAPPRRKTGAPPMLDEPAPEEARGQLGAWHWRCDNTRRCTAFRLVGGGREAAALFLSRAAGPGAGPMVGFAYPASGGGAREAVSIVSGNRRLLPPGGAATLGAWRVATVAPEAIDRLVEIAAAAASVELSLAGTETPLRFELSGAIEVLRRLDALQARGGTRAAWIDRGLAGETRVPWAPVPRQVLVPTVGWRTFSGPLPDDLKAFWRHGCSEAALIERLPESAERAPRGVVLDDGSEIWALPCRTGTYRPRFQIYFRRDGNLEALTHAYRHDGVEPKPRQFERPVFGDGRRLGTFAGFFVDDGVRESAADGRGALFLLADEAGGAAAECRAAWAWNGKWFEKVLAFCPLGGEGGIPLVSERAAWRAP